MRYDGPTCCSNEVKHRTRLYFPRNAPWVDALVRELLQFPTGKFDDQVDVLSLFGRMLI